MRSARAELIAAFLEPRAQNAMRVKSGIIQFRNSTDVYVFLKGVYVDIVHDAKNNNKKKTKANANANTAVNGTIKLTAVGDVIRIIGNFKSFSDRYFDMVFAMNRGRSDVTALKDDVQASALRDNNFLENTVAYFVGHFEEKQKNDMLAYTQYTELKMSTSPDSIRSMYGASRNNPQKIYYDMESTGDISRKIDADEFPLVLTCPGASDAGIMMAFGLQPYSDVSSQVMNLFNKNQQNKIMENMYHRTMNEVGFINEAEAVKKDVRNFVNERIRIHGSVPPVASPSQLAKYVLNVLRQRTTSRFTQWKSNNPQTVQTILDFRNVSYQYKLNGIIIYQATYEFDPSYSLNKGSLEKKFIQSCKVTINGLLANPEWSSGPDAWKYVKLRAQNINSLLALLRKESMDRSVYTLALLNDEIHVTGDISAMANRALLYKIHSALIGRAPKPAMFDNGRVGTTFIVPIRNNRRNNGHRGALQQPNLSNAPNAIAMRAVLGLNKNKTGGKKKPTAAAQGVAVAKGAVKKARAKAKSNNNNNNNNNGVTSRRRPRPGTAMRLRPASRSAANNNGYANEAMTGNS